MLKFPFVFAAWTLVLMTTPANAQAIAATTPADPVAAGYARQIVEIMLPPGRRQEITQGLTQSVMNQIRASVLGQSSDPGLRQIIEDYLAKVPEQLRPVGERHMPWIMDAMVTAYIRQFSADELRQVSEFGKTSAGMHFLSRSLTILSDPAVVHANQVFFNDAAQAANVGAPQFRAAVVDYLNKHPEVARQLQAQVQAKAQQQAQPAH